MKEETPAQKPNRLRADMAHQIQVLQQRLNEAQETAAHVAVTEEIESLRELVARQKQVLSDQEVRIEQLERDCNEARDTATQAAAEANEHAAELLSRASIDAVDKEDFRDRVALTVLRRFEPKRLGGINVPGNIIIAPREIARRCYAIADEFLKLRG